MDFSKMMCTSFFIESCQKVATSCHNLVKSDFFAQLLHCNIIKISALHNIKIAYDIFCFVRVCFFFVYFK